MKNIFFYIAFYIYYAVMYVFKPRRQYVLILLNTFPDDLRKAMSLATDKQSTLGYLILPNSLVLFFDSRNKLKDIHEKISGLIAPEKKPFDVYFLFRVKYKNNQLLINEKLYEMLLATKKTTISSAMDDIEKYFQIRLKLRNHVEKMLNNNEGAMVDEDEADDDMEDHQESNTNSTTIEHVDLILEKIHKTGYNSLTENEKITLHKYTENE